MRRTIRDTGVNIPAALYGMAACLILICGCADKKGRPAPKPDTDGAPAVSAYDAGKAAAIGYLRDYAGNLAEGTSGLSKLIAEDRGKAPDKQDYPDGKRKAKAVESMSQKARESASAANVDKSMAQHFNAKTDNQSDEWLKGYADGMADARSKID